MYEIRIYKYIIQNKKVYINSIGDVKKGRLVFKYKTKFSLSLSHHMFIHSCVWKRELFHFSAHYSLYNILIINILILIFNSQHLNEIAINILLKYNISKLPEIK